MGAPPRSAAAPPRARRGTLRALRYAARPAARALRGGAAPGAVRCGARRAARAEHLTVSIAHGSLTRRPFLLAPGVRWSDSDIRCHLVSPCIYHAAPAAGSLGRGSGPRAEPCLVQRVKTLSAPKLSRVTERSERRASERVPERSRRGRSLPFYGSCPHFRNPWCAVWLGELLRPVRGEPAWRETEPPSRREGRLGSVLYCS